MSISYITVKGSEIEAAVLRILKLVEKMRVEHWDEAIKEEAAWRSWFPWLPKLNKDQLAMKIRDRAGKSRMHTTPDDRYCFIIDRAVKFRALKNEQCVNLSLDDFIFLFPTGRKCNHL